jgi:hypothetical protein
VAVNDGDEQALEYATYAQLAAFDIQSTVVLGDPTVFLPH